jgi:Methyltransferase domain
VRWVTGPSSPISCTPLRTRTPRRINQVGAGASTWVALRAAQDSGHDIEIACVDPFSTDFLKRLGANGTIKLRDVPVQGMSPSDLADLSLGDVLFIDSTHCVARHDVNYVILEVLPRLPAGTFVPFHDVTMPYDYNPEVLSSDLFFWSESVLLHAYPAV